MAFASTRSTRSGLSRAGVIGSALAVAAVTALVPLVPTGASAAGPTRGPAGTAFYTVPPLGSGAHGDLIRYRASKSSILNTGTVSTTIMYRSTAASQTGNPLVDGQATGVTGTVLVPTAKWAGAGPRPIVSYAVGSQGLGFTCSASNLLEAGVEYEAIGIRSALDKGWAVAVTDYQGYTTGDGHTYIVGQTLGRNVLDILKAATQIPGLGLSASAPVGIMGYSEGGQAASWAGQLQPSYLPGARLMGVAAGGVPTDLKDTARFLDGNLFFGFLLDAVYGFHQAYPGLPFDSLINDAGKQAITKLTAPDACLAPTVTAYPFSRISQFVNNGQDLESLLALPGWSKALEANRLGKTRINAPTFLFHGSDDNVIPPATEAAQPIAYCRLGGKVQNKVYDGGDHITTLLSAQGDATQFIADRFAGKPFTSTC